MMKRKPVWCDFGNCHLYRKQHLVLSFEVALMHRNLDGTVNFHLSEKRFFMFSVHYLDSFALRLQVQLLMP